jgi:hypothetical protein
MLYGVSCGSDVSKFAKLAMPRANAGFLSAQNLKPKRKPKFDGVNPCDTSTQEIDKKGSNP